MKKRSGWSIRTILAPLLMLFCAVSCPDPTPPGPDPDTEPDHSEARIFFENQSEEGLYIRGVQTIAYDEFTCQRAWNSDGDNFRIIRDDQSAYMDASYMVSPQSPKDSSASFEINYLSPGGLETVLLIKMIRIKEDGNMRWWWNELQQVGVIIPMFD